MDFDIAGFGATNFKGGVWPLSLCPAAGFKILACSGGVRSKNVLKVRPTGKATLMTYFSFRGLFLCVCEAT
jgi:hypothetical protein